MIVCVHAFGGARYADGVVVVGMVFGQSVVSAYHHHPWHRPTAFYHTYTNWPLVHFSSEHTGIIMQ